MSRKDKKKEKKYCVQVRGVQGRNERMIARATAGLLIIMQTEIQLNVGVLGWDLV